MDSRQFISSVIAAGVYGDAYGYIIEFCLWNQIEAMYGEQGLTELLNNPTVPLASDDTQMTLFVIEGIIKAFKSVDDDPSLLQEDVNELFHRNAKWALLDWYETQSSNTKPHIPHSMFKNSAAMFNRRAPGQTCIEALRDHEGFSTIKNPRNDSKGSGAVMRSAAYVMLYPRYDRDVVWDITAQCAAITHGHIEGWGSAAALAYMLTYMMEGATLRYACQETIKKCAVEGVHSTALLLHKALYFSESKNLSWSHHRQYIGRIGKGWTGDEALAIAVYAALRSKSVYDAIYIGANHSGDSDTTASVAGQLAASWFGMNAFEHRQFDRVDLYQDTVLALELLCQRLYI